MNIAVIDADFISRKRHRFPNLVCEKISGYYKKIGENVILKTDYENLSDFDKIFIAKVFTDTPIDSEILKLPNVVYGGTGFFYDNAQPLPFEIEHSMPDYHLYDDWLKLHDKGGTEFKAYKDYSIGFLTRGCFRHCVFCVNKNYDKVFKHSPLQEFLDTSRKKIYLLDDNFFGYSGWKKLLLELQETQKSFSFRQGLDVKLLNEEKAKILFNSKYDGDFIFAFDDFNDSEIIEQKLKLIRKFFTSLDKIKFYVLCGFDRHGLYDNNFWRDDILHIFARINLLKKYNALPYIMRHKNYLQSPFRGMYITLARYCNMPAVFKAMSFKEFCYCKKNGQSSKNYFESFCKLYPEVTNFI